MNGLNKPKISNKHFAYLLTEAVMGQSLGAKLGGVHYPRGQTKGSTLLPGRRGVEGNQKQ